MKTLFILLTAIIVLSTTSCIKHEQKPCPTDFRVFGEVSPYDSLYHIGDTLTLRTDYYYMVFEKNTKSYYDFKNILNIEAVLNILKIDTVCDNTYSKVTDFVDIIPNNSYNYYIQTYSTGNNTLFSNIILDNDTFHNDVNIVFKKKGLFLLGFGAFSIENKSEFAGKCSLEAFDLSTRLNPYMDNNIQLLALSPDEHFSNWILIQHPNDNFFNRGCFAYKVE